MSENNEEKSNIENEFLLNIIIGMENKRLKQSENNVKIAKIFACALVACVLIICGTVLALNYTYTTEEETTEEIYIDQQADNNANNEVNGVIVGGDVWQGKE